MISFNDIMLIDACLKSAAKLSDYLTLKMTNSKYGVIGSWQTQQCTDNYRLSLNANNDFCDRFRSAENAARLSHKRKQRVLNLKAYLICAAGCQELTKGVEEFIKGHSSSV